MNQEPSIIVWFQCFPDNPSAIKVANDFISQ